MNDPSCTTALEILTETLRRVGLSPMFTPRLFMSPDSTEICVQLTHYMRRPLVNESFLDMTQDLESAVLDSDLVEELRSSVDSELYSAQRSLAELRGEMSQLVKYKHWYEIEAALLKAATEGQHVQDLSGGADC